MKNQLFRHSPDEKVTLQLLSLFGIQNFEDNHTFTRNNLEDLQTVENMNKLIVSLSLYYIPCKAKKYLSELNEKKCITVLRQFLKVHNYTLFSKEKFVKGDKQLYYQIIPKPVNISTDQRERSPIVISFD